MALALFDTLAEFLGILQIGIAILLVKEIFGVFRGEGGGGGIFGGGFKIPKIFGSREASQEGRNEGREAGVMGGDVGREKGEGKEITEIEKIAQQELAKLEQFKTYLEQLRTVRITPEQAKAFAKQNKKKLMDSVIGLINFTERARKLLQDAEKRDRKMLGDFQKILRRRVIDEANAAKKGIPKDQQAQVYARTKEQLHKKIDAYIKQLRTEAFNVAKEEGVIKGALSAAENAEKQVMGDLKMMLDAFAKGDVTSATTHINNAIGAVQAGEQAIAQVARIDELVRRQLSASVGRIYDTARQLNQERVAEHMERVKGL